MIAVIDYGMGNLHSVEKALARVGGAVQLVRDPRAVDDAAGVVLPGVGALGDCMRSLHRLDLVKPILEFINQGRPFLGICLGFQALFESGEESVDEPGLGVCRGTVPRFPENELKVPHMGWNQVRIQQQDCPLWQGIPDESHFYFVHSYYCQPANNELVCGTTDYGLTFCSMIWRDNLFATQFHPEKSQAIGLRMLENFVNVVAAAA